MIWLSRFRILSWQATPAHKFIRTCAHGLFVFVDFCCALMTNLCLHETELFKKYCSSISFQLHWFIVSLLLACKIESIFQSVRKKCLYLVVVVSYFLISQGFCEDSESVSRHRINNYAQWRECNYVPTFYETIKYSKLKNCIIRVQNVRHAACRNLICCSMLLTHDSECASRYRIKVVVTRRIN